MISDWVSGNASYVFLVFILLVYETLGSRSSYARPGRARSKNREWHVGRTNELGALFILDIYLWTSLYRCLVLDRYSPVVWTRRRHQELREKVYIFQSYTYGFLLGENFKADSLSIRRFSCSRGGRGWSEKSALSIPSLSSASQGTERPQKYRYFLIMLERYVPN